MTRPVSHCFAAHLLPFLLSCGDHFNPDGTSHGGPEDSDRVSVHLGEAEAARGPKASGRADCSWGLSVRFLFGGVPSLYFVPFRNIDPPWG